MNKNSNFLFLGLTLLVLFVSIGEISAVDMDDSTNNIISDNTVDNSHDTLTNNNKITSEKNFEVKSNVKSVNKNATTQKTIKTDKQTKKAVETIQTATDYETLKTSWNNIQNDGDNTTEYIINIKNGKYTFDEELKSNSTSNTKYITINGENWDQTIFDGQNKTRLFNLNNTNQVIKFNNITFINGFNNTMGGAIYVNSTAEFNNTKFMNNTVFANDNNTNTHGGALYIRNPTIIANSIFDNNNIEGFNFTYGGALYSTTASLDIYNSSFTNNYIIDHTEASKFTAYGGAIYISASKTAPIKITLCEFINNTIKAPETHTRKSNGGAIYNTGNGYVNISFCNFIENKANFGGAINFQDTYGKVSADVMGCVFDKNKALINSTNIYNKGSYHKLSDSANLYIDNSDVTDILVLTNDKTSKYVFNQKTKTITINCMISSSTAFGHLTYLGRGYSLALKSSSDLINTTGLTFNHENNYSQTIDISKLPANHENITLYVGDIKATTIVYDYTNVTFNNITAKPGSTITISSTFKTSDNKLIPNGKVAFKINGKTVGHTQIEFGTAKLNYTIPDNYSEKDYILTTTYGGSSKFIEARTNATLHLEKLATKTNLTTTIEGNTLKITVDPKDENGNTVRNGKICVKIEGKTLQTIKITGKTTVNFTIPKRWNNREIKVLAIYGENNNHKESRMEIKTKITLPNTKTTKTDEAINNYYVSANSGSDSNTGSQTSPFKTIQKAITTVTNNKQPANIYLDGNFKGVGNTNLTIPGNLHINFIGVGNSSIDGEVSYDLIKELGEDEYYWGSSDVWMPYLNATGNWAMNITRGNGLITITNFTIKNCWNKGGSSISLYETATVDNYGNLEVNNVSFTFNHGGVGASIRNNNGSNITVTNCFFEANRKSSSTGNYGSGIYNNGTATIINSTFQKNYARWGTITNDKKLTIINSTIRDNMGYDGGSTYKTGAGITINTESTDFYANLTIENVETVVDGCIFINNSQSDIYADTGSASIKNNIFNRSQGISSISGNKLQTFNITNNTFDSIDIPYGHDVSYDIYSVPILLQGAYPYIINSNTIINVPGTFSIALNVKSDNVIIENNTIEHRIIIQGTNNTIRYNNITTSKSQFAVDIEDYKNNSVTDNNLISSMYMGNSAVNYTYNGNIVERNTPELKELKVNDSNFYRFFDDDGNLLSNYNNIDQIQIIGILTNKNIILNKNMFITKTGRFLCENITITSNAELNVTLLNITNTNKEPVLILNGNNGIIKNSNMTTNNNNTIIVNGENNIIENNTLLADIYVGDESVKTEKTNQVDKNKPLYKNFILTEENYNTYFNTNGSIKDLNINEVHFMIVGTIKNKDIILDNNKTTTLTNYKDAKLLNCTIKTLGTSSLNMTYLTVENTNGKVLANLNTPNNNISYNNITVNNNAINSVDSNKITISYNNITTITNTNITTINITNTVTPTVFANNIITKGLDNVTSISINGVSKQLNVSLNNITINSNINTTNEKVAINIINQNFSNRCIVEKNNIKSTTEYITLVKIEKGLVELSGNNLTTLANNSIGTRLINIKKNIGSNYFVESNIITTNGINSIGMFVESSNNVSIGYNSFIVNGDNSVATFINSTYDVTVASSDFTLNGYNNIALLLNNTDSIYIVLHNITLFKNNNNDNIAPLILNNATRSNITQNMIQTAGKYSVILNNTSSLNFVERNVLYTNETMADDTVLNANHQNRVMDNLPDELTYFYLDENTYSKYFDDNGNLRDNIPEGILIQVTGQLSNKTLNINKPINIISNSIVYSNVKLIISENADNTNITGLSFNGNSNIVVNANNCNLNLNITNVVIDQPFLTINGNNNTIITSNMNINSVENTTNTSLIKITGNNNKITTSLRTSNFNKVIAINLENANNTIITGSSLSVSGINATAIILNNSNNNTLNIERYTINGNLLNQGLLFINSSYNKINGNITQSQPVSYIIKLEDNSNFNEFKNMGIINTNVVTTPILLIDSHNNIFYNNTYNFTNLHDYAINITESVGNKVEYNAIITGSFKGNEAVVQENKNETINNQVRNNGESTGYITRLIITTPDIKMLDTITITATVDYNTGRSWRPNYVTATDGYVVFIVNGEQIANITIVDGKATANYTITPKDETLSIEALYENPKLTNQPALTTTTITPQKLESKVLLANVTNNGVTTLITAIIIDEKGNIIYDGNVTFKVDDIEVKTIEIQNGIAQTTINVANITLGEHKLIAEYNGNTVYLISNTTSTLTVNKFDANIIVEPVNITAGKTTTLKATVTDANGNMLNSGRAVFKLNGCTLKDANGKTIYANVVDGIASINYTIPPSYTPKDYTLTAVASDNKYNRIEANTTLKVTKTTPKIQIPNTIKRTKNTQITINITDENGNKINSNQKVCLKFNGCTITNTKAINGTVNINLDLTKYKNPQYEITFICGENSQYTTSKLTSILNIE